MVPGIRRMLDISKASAQGSDGGANPVSSNPSISYDGRYTAFESKATNLIDGEQQGSNKALRNGGTDTEIFRNDINADPNVGWNLLVSKHAGVQANEDCIRPAINEGGTRIAFESTATNLGYASATTSNIYLWDINSTSLKFVSIPLSGAEGANVMATTDRSGRYVGFRSGTIGLVSDVTNNTPLVYVKDVDSNVNQYTLASRGASGQVPSAQCTNPAMSGDGNYMVFESAAKNLTNDSYTNGTTDVFIRKWK
jgi:Tol biopolymer transport system component